MLGFFRRLMPRQSFARNVLTLTGATAFSQAVALLALPFLTRLYGPDAFGAAATFLSVVSLVGVVSSLRYELAVPLARTDRGAWHVVIVAILILIMVTLIAVSAAQFSRVWLAEGSNLPILLFELLLAVGILTLGIYQITNYWAVRKSHFELISRTRVQQGVAGPLVQLALGFTGLGSLGLILGQISGQCVGLLRLTAGMISDNKHSGMRIHRRGLSWAAKRYRRFPIYDSWAGLLNVAGGQAPVLLFAVLFSPALAGYYALASRILSAPLGLVGNAVSQVLLPRLIVGNRDGEIAELMFRSLGVLAMLSLVPFSFVAVIAPDIIALLFGHEWAPGGVVIAWTAGWVGWQFICSPLSVVLVAVEAQRLNVLLQATLLVPRVAALAVGAWLGSPDIALAAFSIASAFGYISYTLATGIAVGLSVRCVGLAIWKPSGLAGLCLVGAILAPLDAFGVRYLVATFAVSLWIRFGWGLLRRHNETQVMPDTPKDRL